MTTTSLRRLRSQKSSPAPGHTGTAGLSDPDEVPELPAEPITKPGDLWILGDHRLLCGDATDPADVAA